MTPNSDNPSAKPAPIAAPGRLRSSTMGRVDPARTASSSSLASQSARTSPIPWAITARAFPSRRLRRRSSATASALLASHTRWKPPSPFTAKIFPAMSISTAAAKMASDSSRVFPSEIGPSAPTRHVTEGPHSKQASGWAWKRRSSGSAYSAAHFSHMGNAAMEVATRS